MLDSDGVDAHSKSWYNIIMRPPKRLTLEQDLNVKYCIPTWLRDEQVRHAMAAVPGRIEQWTAPLREDNIAIVCYGPSLVQTWEHVRDFKYIMTCSGAHKFLIDRGVVPTWHVEVDPRTHKIELLGPPHKDVEYLIASACHPKYFEHLAGYNVKLWHIFSTEEEALRILPSNEWAITGGCSVGLRCLTLARFIGFKFLHVFGMDGSEGETGKHAAAHPNQQKAKDIVEFDGVEYVTTPGFLEAAKAVPHEVDMLSDTTIQFYGTGLVQAMMKKHVRQPKKDAIIGVCKPTLISAEYCQMNTQLHKHNLAYGVGGGKHATTVIQLAEKLNTHSILDYGCGKGYLAKAIPFPIWEYDPAIPEKAASPRPADLVVCTDVLEHIEPECIDYVLADLQRCTKQLGFFVIHTGPSLKTLPDGRNAHILQREKDWWKTRLSTFFRVAKVFDVGPLMYVVVVPREKKPKIFASVAKTQKELAHG
jgi:uncharacterized Rossmann fold enzyme